MSTYTFEGTLHVIVSEDTKGNIGFIGDNDRTSPHGMQMLFWNPSQKDKAETYAKKCRALGLKARAVAMQVTWKETE